MTGGRLQARAAATSTTRTFCFTYGDGVADVDITRAGRVPPRAGRAGDRHRRAAARPLRRAGGRGRPRHRLREKPQGDGGWINGGFFVLSPRGRRATSTATTPIWEHEPLERLARDGRARRVYKHDGFWQPMDTLRDKRQLRGAVGRRATRRGRRGSRPRRSGAAGGCCVTGHTGFKGSWLALWLAEPGRGGRRASRGVADRARRCSSSRGVGDGVTAIEADIRDADAVRDARRRRAARGRVPPGRAAARAALLRRPGRDLRDQRDGHGQRARGRARAPTSVRVVVIVTTDKCYENREWVWALPRGRADGRPRPVQQQQGLRRARDRRLPALVLRRRGRRRRSPPRAPAT